MYDFTNFFFFFVICLLISNWWLCDRGWAHFFLFISKMFRIIYHNFWEILVSIKNTFNQTIENDNAIIKNITWSKYLRLGCIFWESNSFDQIWQEVYGVKKTLWKFPPSVRNVYVKIIENSHVSSIVCINNRITYRSTCFYANVSFKRFFFL